jgi:polysaccharide biosynthesis/export protein
MKVTRLSLAKLIFMYIVLLPGAGLTQETLFTEYRIGPADLLSIVVWQQPELSRTLVVRPDGFVTYPLLGDIKVEGMTPEQMRVRIVDSLQAYLSVMLSEVTVSVDAVNSYTVSVLGEVNTPGRFSFQSQVTVLDVLAEAGGFTSFASTSKILIVRNENGVTRRIPFDYRRVARGRITQQEMTVFPGDIIMVP